jgi:hypothetical protein
MNEVDFHPEGPAVDLVLARVMKMELGEKAGALGADFYFATRRGFERDRVSVNVNGVELFAPRDFKRRQLRGDRLYNVDR